MASEYEMGKRYSTIQIQNIHEVVMHVYYKLFSHMLSKGVNTLATSFLTLGLAFSLIISSRDILRGSAILFCENHNEKRKSGNIDNIYEVSLIR